LQSKIINMAEKLKDEGDKRLETLFSLAPVRDDGFSIRVVSHIRRRLWVRRLSLPVAFVVGGAVSIKPVLQLAGAIPALLGSIPDGLLNLDKLPISSLPQLSTIIMGAALLVVVMIFARMLEE